MSEQRLLVLIRHAKAETPGNKPDHDRVLTDRGLSDAAAVGNWLKEKGLQPDAVWCSTAARTRETWAAIVERSGNGSLVDHDQRIYDAAPGALLDVLRESPERARIVALVGHAPGVPAIAAALTEGSGSQIDFHEHFRTSGVAVLEIPAGWPDLAPGAASVRELFVGRG
ncbi:SixA phosphatase family protein [Calidifontibacter terrae]